MKKPSLARSDNPKNFIPPDQNRYAILGD